MMRKQKSSWTPERLAQFRATMAKKNGNGRPAGPGIRFALSRSTGTILLLAGEKQYDVQIVE